MQYKIVSDNHPELLEDKINKLIAEGWEPLGGVACVQDDVQTFFYQAVVKDE